MTKPRNRSSSIQWEFLFILGFQVFHFPVAYQSMPTAEGTTGVLLYLTWHSYSSLHDIFNKAIFLLHHRRKFWRSFATRIIDHIITSFITLTLILYRFLWFLRYSVPCTIQKFRMKLHSNDMKMWKHLTKNLTNSFTKSAANQTIKSSAVHNILKLLWFV